MLERREEGKGKGGTGPSILEWSPGKYTTKETNFTRRMSTCKGIKGGEWKRSETSHRWKDHSGRSSRLDFGFDRG